ncbi:MAG: DUF456 domain-containing protein [Elusimicrobia bacterium]|nr:DUF456 domain-containing protein [Elusimicrobiota bacterium]
MKHTSAILSKMNIFWVALALFCAGSIGIADDKGAAQPTGQAPADVKTGLAHDDFVGFFGNAIAPSAEDCWKQYQAMPAEQKAKFESDFNTAKANPSEHEKMQFRYNAKYDFAKAAGAQPAVTPSKDDSKKIDLGPSKDKIDGATGGIAGNCPSKVFDNNGKCAEVPAAGPRPSANDSQKGQTPPKTTGEQQNLIAQPTPPPDVKAPAAATKTADPAMMVMVKRGFLGALAGAAIGIGLLPLLGPFGILIGALMGAGITVATGLMGGGGGGS